MCRASAQGCLPTCILSGVRSTNVYGAIHSCVSSALRDDPGPGQTRTGHFALVCTVLHWEGPRASWVQPRGTKPRLGIAQSFWRWYLS